MKTRERLDLIHEDCKADASKPVEFTQLGIGTIYGELLAMIDALAASMLELVDQVEAIDATLDRAEAAAARSGSVVGA